MRKDPNDYNIYYEVVKKKCPFTKEEVIDLISRMCSLKLKKDIRKYPKLNKNNFHRIRYTIEAYIGGNHDEDILFLDANKVPFRVISKWYNDLYEHMFLQTESEGRTPLLEFLRNTLNYKKIATIMEKYHTKEFNWYNSRFNIYSCH
jgi:hypothetical protein